MSSYKIASLFINSYSPSSTELAQVSSVLNSAHLKLVGVVSKKGVGPHFSRSLLAHIVKHPSI